MKLETLLSPERTAYLDDINSRKTLLERLSALICKDFADIDPHVVFESYLARERLGSTALGHGVAIPHIRCSTLNTPRAAMVRLHEAIPFDDQDNRVDIIFALAVPEAAHEDHLSILSKLAGTLHPKENRQRIRSITDNFELYKTLCDCYDRASS